MTNITREEISEFINIELGLTKQDCNDIVNDIIEEIIQGLTTSKKVKIHNFGTFVLKHKKTRKGRNPKTKEEVWIKPRNVISFIPSRKVLNTLNAQLKNNG